MVLLASVRRHRSRLIRGGFGRSDRSAVSLALPGRLHRPPIGYGRATDVA